MQLQRCLSFYSSRDTAAHRARALLLCCRDNMPGRNNLSEENLPFGLETHEVSSQGGREAWVIEFVATGVYS